MQDVSQAPIQLFLQRLLRRSKLSQKEQGAILALGGDKERWSAHYDIVSPGQTVRTACLVVQGLVGRYDTMRDGQRQLTSFYIAGDMCDLHSVVVPKATWSITAVSDSVVLRVPHEQLVELCVHYPSLALAFWRDGTVDASIFAKWVGNLGRKNSKARITHLFCEMALRNEAANLAPREAFELPVTQQQLADATGLTGVHVNRMLQEIRNDGLLTYHKGHVAIPNWGALTTAAEFDAAYLMLGEPQRRIAPATDGQREASFH